jgi:hypothetical protein
MPAQRREGLGPEAVQIRPELGDQGLAVRRPTSGMDSSRSTCSSAGRRRVDDILTIPFAPEELLARVIALVRRAYSHAVTFTPVIKLGELEIDILNRTPYPRPGTVAMKRGRRQLSWGRARRFRI